MTEQSKGKNDQYNPEPTGDVSKWNPEQIKCYAVNYILEHASMERKFSWLRSSCRKN